MTQIKTGLDEAYATAAEWINAADSLVIGAGAGMGVDSGLPDFRGKHGFWRAYPALENESIGFTDIANPLAFYGRPRLAWGFYGHRLNLYRQTEPHAGYRILLGWGEKMRYRYRVFTSNVDGHFLQAGFDENAIHECHGSIHFLQCLEPCNTDIWSANSFIPDIDEERCYLRNKPPRCQRCGNISRPNILMFNDGDWIYERTRKQVIAQEQWLESVAKPLVIEIGAGTAIPSVRHFSRRMQKEYRAKLIRINPDDAFSINEQSLTLPVGALEALQKIAAMVEVQPGIC
ncbi:MAG TPA: Sir2 family NAD-dependent protein deacetylase [Cellvibrio sp.]|nr:Sir2 family NAD-dependent protein deacetylase [Cellvibrio sp.]